MEVMWLAVVAGLGALQKLLQKKYSDRTRTFRSSGTIYTWIMAIASTVYYSAMAGFSLEPDRTMLILSVIYAVVVISSLMYTNFVYRKMSLTKVTLFSSCGALVGPYIFDVAFLGGGITVKKTAAVLLLLTVFVLPLFESGENKKASRAELLFGTVTFLISGMSTVICKLFTIYSDSTRGEAFCFWTNLFMIPFLALKLLASRDKGIFVADVKAIGLRFGWISAVVGFVSAVGAPITFSMIEKMNVTVYTIVSSSLGLIFAAMVSAFVFRERPDKRTVIGLAAAIGAIVLNSI